MFKNLVTLTRWKRWQTDKLGFNVIYICLQTPHKVSDVRQVAIIYASCRLQPINALNGSYG